MPNKAEPMSEQAQCCGTCARVRRVGEGGLTNNAGICGAAEDAGYGELVVLLDYPLQGSKCDEYQPIPGTTCPTHERREGEDV